MTELRNSNVRFLRRFRRAQEFAGLKGLKGRKMHSKDTDNRLETALRDAGLGDLANKAGTGFYSDFGSPLAFPKMALAEELAADGSPAALRIRARVIMGDFDD